MLEVPLVATNNESDDFSAYAADNSKCTKCNQGFTFLSIIRGLWKIISFLLSYIIIWSIISEILLLIEVYSIGDIKFFALSCVFLACPLLLASALLCLFGDEVNVLGPLGYIPIINIPLSISCKAATVKPEAIVVVETLLVGTMTFPLYIINLSYLCELEKSYENISIYNIIPLILSVITFIKTPPLSVVQWTLDQNPNADQTKLLLSSCLTFLPIVMVEIIHFFPFIFAYYIDQVLNYNDLIWIMLIFNVPKLIFIIHANRRIFTRENNGNIGKCITCVVFTLILITIPLIPYLFIIFSKYSQKNNTSLFHDGYCGSAAKYYWNITAYLTVSYGGSVAYIAIIYGLDALSLPVQISIITLIVLIVITILTFPITYGLMKNSGVEIYQFL
eukprot:176624_1